MLLVDQLALPAFSGLAAATVVVRPRSGRIRRVHRCRDEILRYRLDGAAACAGPGAPVPLPSFPRKRESIGQLAARGNMDSRLRGNDDQRVGLPRRAL